MQKLPKLAASGFDPPTSGLWAQHASTAPRCYQRSNSLLIVGNGQFMGTPCRTNKENPQFSSNSNTLISYDFKVHKSALMKFIFIFQTGI
ncbi:Alpha-N-acetylgalactosaminidase [Dirofilaria immitis]